jgi:hypothetical protein
VKQARGEARQSGGEQPHRPHTVALPGDRDIEKGEM